VGLGGGIGEGVVAGGVIGFEGELAGERASGEGVSDNLVAEDSAKFNTGLRVS
jgi:hypothetical protein